MTSGSAAPADLVRELKRALPQMVAADADRSNWSQGRVLADFGRSIGIPLDDADSIEELQGRLARVTEAWNALPTEERLRLMPDPRPRTARGAEMTRTLNEARVSGVMPEDDDPREEFPHYRPGDVVRAGRQAESSAFVQSCLALADWVGDRREVTSIGVLRPAAAREAHDHLGLYDWEEAYQEAAWGEEPQQAPEVRAMLAASAPPGDPERGRVPAAGSPVAARDRCRPHRRRSHGGPARRGPRDRPAGACARPARGPHVAPVRGRCRGADLPPHERDGRPRRRDRHASRRDAWWERSPLAGSTSPDRRGFMRQIADRQVRTARVCSTTPAPGSGSGTS